jgi:F-type H+-transporting ATPase subunit a
MLFSFTRQFNHNIAHLVPEGTPAALIPLMVVIERISLIIRPFTLAIRLSANMIAGHLLLTLLGSQGPSAGVSRGALLILSLCLLLTLECAVACIQAYVFTILSTLYLEEHNSVTMSKVD